MPGMTLVRGQAPRERPLRPLFETVCFLDDYSATVTRVDDRTVVGHTGYDDYPVRLLDTPAGLAFVEGHLYDVDDTDAHLSDVSSALADGDWEWVARWVADRDGDFLVGVCTGDRIRLVNDTFARLPLYYAELDGTVVLSRELKLVRELAQRVESATGLDRLAVAQQLLFGYPLGDRTPFEGVRTVPPGSIATVDEEVILTSIHDHRFDTFAHRDRSIAENGHQLAARIETACRNRVDTGGQHIVSLSGGLDSRTAAAAYTTLDSDAVAATFEVADTDEMQAARTVADTLDIPWELVPATETPAHRQLLFETKQGMNHLGMAYILDFFTHLRSSHDAPVCVTGDGGDKILDDLTPPSSVDTTEALTRHVIESEGRFSPAHAAAVAGVDAATLRCSVERRLQAYPESDLAARYVHFLVRERGCNFLVHGEDRNRYFTWSTTPFYALPVFRYAMNCPPAQKRYRRLNRAVLEAFDPALLAIEYPNFGARIDSLEYRLKRFGYDVLGAVPELRDRIVDVLRDSADQDEVAARIRNLLTATDDLPLSERAVRDALDGADSPMQYHVLLTAVTLAQSLATARVTPVPENEHSPDTSG